MERPLSVLRNLPEPSRSELIALRDRFAEQALASMGVWCPPGTDGDLTSSATLRARADWAYAQADYLLVARSA